MAADIAFLLNIKKKAKIQANLNPRMYTEVGNTENRALSQPTALFSENVSQTEVDSMGLQDNRILSPFLAIWVFCFLSPLVWGGPSFFVPIFFPAVNSCQHNLHQLEIRNQKKKFNHNNKKIQKSKTDSQTAHRYTVTCWRVIGRAPKAKSSGIVGPLAHFITRRHAHGALHSQKHRTAAHNVRR